MICKKYREKVLTFRWIDIFQTQCCYDNVRQNRNCKLKLTRHTRKEMVWYEKRKDLLLLVFLRYPKRDSPFAGTTSKKPFLVGELMPDQVGADFYQFYGYHYGPFDKTVYDDAEKGRRERAHKYQTRPWPTLGSLFNFGGGKKERSKKLRIPEKISTEYQEDRRMGTCKKISKN